MAEGFDENKMEMIARTVARETAHEILTNLDIDSRLTSLEKWKNEEAVKAAVGDERKKYMEERFNKIDVELASIKNSFWKVFWVLATAVGVYVINFMLAGGLRIG